LIGIVYRSYLFHDRIPADLSLYRTQLDTMTTYLNLAVLPAGIPEMPLGIIVNQVTRAIDHLLVVSFVMDNWHLLR
jgi:hypothetical protein